MTNLSALLEKRYACGNECKTENKSITIRFSKAFDNSSE